jgi:hypothetical protein
MEGAKGKRSQEIVDKSDGKVLFIAMIPPNGMNVKGKNRKKI